MKTTYDKVAKRFNISLTPREANLLQETLSEYYATVARGEHSILASDIDIALCHLPEFMEYWRNRQ